MLAAEQVREADRGFTCSRHPRMVARPFEPSANASGPPLAHARPRRPRTPPARSARPHTTRPRIRRALLARCAERNRGSMRTASTSLAGCGIVPVTIRDVRAPGLRGPPPDHLPPPQLPPPIRRSRPRRRGRLPCAPPRRQARPRTARRLRGPEDRSSPPAPPLNRQPITRLRRAHAAPPRPEPLPRCPPNHATGTAPTPRPIGTSTFE